MTGEKIKVSCAVCGKTNFYPAEAGGKKVLCGRCRSPLPAPGAVLEPGLDGAEALLRNSSLPVLVDFFSPTCGPCLAMDPIVRNLALRRAGDVVVMRVAIERLPELAQAFRVQGVPTFVVVHKGVERARTSGATNEMNFSLWVASNT